MNRPPHPSIALTVGGMITMKWLVTAYCPTCRRRTHVDLDVIRLRRGDDYVLWGVRSRCKTWVRWTLDRRCEGRVIFWAQSCPNGSVVEMRMTRQVLEAKMRRDGLDPHNPAGLYRYAEGMEKP